MRAAGEVLVLVHLVRGVGRALLRLALAAFDQMIGLDLDDLRR